MWFKKYNFDFVVHKITTKLAVVLNIFHIILHVQFEFEQKIEWQLKKWDDLII